MHTVKNLLCRDSDDEESRIGGRPFAVINLDEVEFFRSINLNWTTIAAKVGVSRQTLYRRLKKEGIYEDLRYSSLSDNELDDVLRHIKINHPNDGEVLMHGHLSAMGLKIQRYRLRSALHRVDPIGIAQRRRIVVRRRRYHVEHPNCIWHIDGHHKLIRWRLVTHGGIDGCSRLITFLRCSSNNKASTVLTAFSEAAYKYGLPLRVRSDLGGENVDVWRYMVAQYDGDEYAVITGSSTHNERIERLWWDVFRCVGQLFYDTFHSLEDECLLDPLNETDIFCLHFVYLPLINKCLDEFVQSWNHHRISTERNKTPYQLHLTDYQSLPQQDVNLSDNHFRTVEGVNVPRSNFRCCQVLEQLLSNSIDRTTEFGDLGISAYKHTVALVGSHVAVCQACNSS